MWRKVRAGLMFGIACITSPCCTPLIVPLILALLAGSPAAVWLGQNIGWVYGGLTLISVVSLVLGFRWMNRRSVPRGITKPATTIELSRPNESKL
jgi:predicted MFS family arabinose efflux permease